ncbi:hypothetical protein [Dictyobacter kobayashii]|uniref:Uncharacterized protein n=1 Tax=Dictyobacter kobayashii TaxID=2014872 RepID=A0A402APT9_9CHLR|nr:hypothetical protein [Dictyobacter kobayashii]GCE21183.1 hypothetical protein KDK_49830 [Dictyobacter kobayashii]
MLAFGSPELVALYLPQVSQKFNHAQWRRLARLQPDLALAALQQRLDNLAEQEDLFIRHFNAVIPILTRSRPDALLALLRSPLLVDLLASLELKELWRQRPDDLLELVLATHVRIDLDEYAVYRRLTPEHLSLLARQYNINASIDQWLKILSPEQRVAFFEAQLQHMATEGFVPLDILDLLPRQQREQEARRVWSLTDLSLHQLELRRQYASLLPWPEALEKLDYELHHADVERRAQALEILAGVVAYQRERLPELLALFLEHRNEPDPARLSMFDGLKELPPSAWRTEQLPGLAELLRISLEASDLSHGTLVHLVSFLIRLAAFHPQWAAEQIAAILQTHGTSPLSVYFYGVSPLEEYLRAEHIRSMAPLLLPVLSAWLQQDKYEALMDCAEAFASQLRSFPELAQLLAQALPKVQTIEAGQRILKLLVRWQPALTNTLIPTLVQQDPSWILAPAVKKYLQRYRQDLLAAFLARTTIQGRFSLEETSFLLEVESPLSLTQSQQERYAGRLEQAMVGERGRRVPKKIGLQLAALPAILPERLLTFIQDQDKHNYYQRQAAINALSKLDTSLAAQTIFSLLREQAEKDGATSMGHSLMAALWRPLRRMPEAEAFRLLTSHTFTQLTLQKEITFLIGRLSLDAAYQYLLQLQTRPELHPDLQAAGVRALWNHLDRPQTWEILQQAARAASSSTAFKIGHILSEQLAPQELQQLLRLFHTALQHATSEARLELLQNIARLTLRDTQRILTPALLSAMLSPTTAEAESAITAFMTICTDRDIPQLQENVRILCRDRRRLFKLLPCFSLWSSPRYHRYRDLSASKLKSKRKLALALLAVLAEYPATSKVRLDNAFKLLSMADIIEVLKQLAEADQLYPEVLVDACERLQHSRTVTTDDLEAVQAALAEHPDERLRRVALAALTAQAHAQHYSSNWTPALIARLYRYQSDPSPLVLEAALTIFPEPREA